MSRMRTWEGRWECACGATGDSASIVYKTVGVRVSLRCPKCDRRIVLNSGREDGRRSEDTSRQA
jgi:hypothetical protein